MFVYLSPYEIKKYRQTFFITLSKRPIPEVYVYATQWRGKLQTVKTHRKRYQVEYKSEAGDIPETKTKHQFTRFCFRIYTQQRALTVLLQNSFENMHEHHKHKKKLTQASGLVLVCDIKPI